jgi:predicted ATPase
MKLKNISIKNFRAIHNLQVEIGAHTVFIGSNGVGK